MNKFTGTKLLIGSHNQYKVDQLSKYFANHGHSIELQSPRHFNIPAPPEVGDTFEENCQSKAIYYGKATGLVTVSDDSGICVDALGGAPGIYTADWAIDGDFSHGIIRLKQELNAKDGEKYDAKMVSVISIYWPQTDEIQSFRAETLGYVNFDHISSPGVGFQPIFYPHPHTIPSGLLTEEEHSQVNARAKSLKKLLDACF